MKNIRTILYLSAAALIAPLANADEVRTTVTSSQGVVSSVAPDALLISSDAAPGRYTFTKTTRYFDAAGNPITVQEIRKGEPVRIEYIRRGDVLEASKVVVTAPPTAAVTTVQPSETAGTVTEFGDGSLVVRSESGPAHFTYSKTTQWVDEDGNVVTQKTINNGAPVTVYYTDEDGRTVVSKVVVHRRQTPAVIEKHTTTTTTTTTSKGHHHDKDKDKDDDDDKD